MMDRCAVLVDAGYLLGAAGTLLGGEADRSNLEVEYERLVGALIDEAQRQTGMPVLRVLWYDAAYNAQPTPDHRALRVLPDVKVRLGELVKRGNRVQQKGVDSYLQRDLTALARNHAVADAVLVGGDEDLRRALEEAQDYGVRVHLWGVEAAAPEYNQSQSLIGEADRRWVISGGWIGEFVRLREANPATAAAPEASDAPSVEERTPEQPRSPAARVTPRVSPADIARLQTAFHHRDGGRPEPAGRTGRGWEVRPVEHDDIPRLQTLTTARQAWLDNEEDATHTTANPAEVGARFGSRWAARASREQREALLANQKPPPYLDGELLRYAERSGIDTWDDEPAKHAVRGGFWESVSRSPS
ncbi:MAG TPA: NYN domain-containing protein [Amycolatopsis sp.]|uniref:NYN domain-containing protein n=1 Tax=Amycolatopsis sp. TaxID=37632 RepID=UPI002B495FE3|nr:NYN domain-containing protein [Amycolatopsis sp.]HKS49118.1 NYN domain-containing protein [Amycolatopsis sp.]